MLSFLMLVVPGTAENNPKALFYKMYWLNRCLKLEIWKFKKWNIPSGIRKVLHIIGGTKE